MIRSEPNGTDAVRERAELLAPAGSYDIFRAVLTAGADAVYAGAQRFSARSYARNLTDDEILRAMDEAHVHGKRFYLAMNTLLKEEELPEALTMLERLYAAGLDAVIIQDLGLAREISRFFPQLALHASTQMSISGPYGLTLLSEYGFSQAVLPRELSLAEIRTCAAQTDLKLECFVHGALCYCYSGKCLMSSVIGGRSANRGKCAQPCRLPYSLRNPEKRRETYPLSLKDLCAADQIPALLDAGVSSFKIEGRMKGLEYAAGVTRIYRELLDRALEERPGLSRGEREGTRERLEHLGSRCGFTDAYLNPAAAGGMLSMHHSSHSRDAQDAFVQEVRSTCAAGPEKVPVEVRVRIRRGCPLEMTLKTGPHSVTVYGETVQEASSRPLDEETVREKCTRLGETPFSAAGCIIELDDGCFCPVSALNVLRREAVGKLLKFFRPQRDAARVPAGERAAGGRRPAEGTFLWKGSGERPLLMVSVCGRTQLSAVLADEHVDAVIPETASAADAAFPRQAAEKIHAAGKICIAPLPHMLRPDAAQRMRRTLREMAVLPEETRPDAYLLRCPDELALLREEGAAAGNPVLISDAGLYAWNGAARAFLRENGVALFTAPYELSRREVTAQDTVLTLYGRTPLMVSAQVLPGNGQHLTDRMGKRFPVRRDRAGGENIIYNCVPTVLFAQAERIRSMGFSGYRMDFLSENPHEIRQILDEYAGAFSGGAAGSGITGLTQDFTYGAWKRGTE